MGQNFIADFLRGQVMAENPEYAKRVYEERDLQNRINGMQATMKAFPHPEDAPRYQAMLYSQDPATADKFLESTFPKYEHFQRVIGPDGRIGQFDIRRGGETYTDNISPQYDPNMVGNLARIKERQKMVMVTLPDGSQKMMTKGEALDLSNGANLPQDSVSNVKGYVPGKFNVYSDADSLTPEQQNIMESIQNLHQSGKITAESAMKMLESAGFKSDFTPDNQSTPVPVPLDGQSSPSDLLGQTYSNTLSVYGGPTNPIRQAPFGATNQSKLDIELQKKNAEANKQIAVDLAKRQNEIKVNLPTVDDSYAKAVHDITALKNHPAKSAVVGMPESVFGITSKMGIPTPTPEWDFKNRLRQLQDKSFLAAYNILKGGGQISNIEGEKATGALLRANTALTEEDFDQALNDMLNEMKTGREAAYKRAGQPVPIDVTSKYKAVSKSGRLKIVGD